jgi:hypothetical protein
LTAGKGREGKQVRAFLKKSAAKNFFDAGLWAVTAPQPMTQHTKVFCFFFSKKKRFLT